MKRAVSGVVFLCLVAVSPLMAQAPKPGPELKMLERLVGTWTYEGDAKATPLGPAAKVSGTQTGRMVMGGFALEWRGEEKGVFGAIQWTELDVYDSATKTYPFFGVQNDGVTWNGAGVSAGSAWKSTGTQTVKGVTYKTRSDATPSADGRTWTQKLELSTDGKTWMPWMDVKMTKSPGTQR